MLTVAFHFGVPGLWVKTELLGASFDVEQDGYACRLTFPKDAESFGMKDYEDPPICLPISGVMDPATTAIELRVVQVKVKLETDINADDIPAGEQHDEQKFDELQELLKEAVEAARAVVVRLIRRSRTDHGQSWLLPQFQPPTTVWITDIRDEQDRWLATGYHDPLGATIGMWRHSIGKAEVDTLLRDRLDPPLAAELLADAHYLILDKRASNPSLAIVLAAMSAEVGIKRFLTDRATEDQASLLELVINNPREVTLAAASLYDHALQAVVGRSYKTDHKEQYRALNALFTARNHIAHREKYASGDASPWDHFRAAREAAEYLASL